MKAGYNQSPEVYCAAPKRIIVRYRFGLTSSGKPATATMAVWAKRKKASAAASRAGGLRLECT